MVFRSYLLDGIDTICVIGESISVGVYSPLVAASY